MLTEHRFQATRSRGEVSGLLLRPPGAEGLLVVGHGAGAGMRHPFLESVAEGLAARGLATFRYQFPYMEAGKRGPDYAPILVKTVRSAVRFARDLEPDLALFAGGKSMGGRMTSLAASSEPLEGVRGLVFFGFPLHAIGKPSAERGDHLSSVGLPMLFLQGDRDRLADLDLLRPIVKRLPSAELHVEPSGDHSFKVLKRSGRTDEEALGSVCDRAAAWVHKLLASARS